MKPIILLIVYAFICRSFLHCQEAIITVPVADLVGEPDQLNPIIPLCGSYLGPHSACPRLHQALYNERVTVLKKEGPLCHISLPNLFYVASDKKKKLTTFWTSCTNLTLLHDIHDSHKDLIIPAAITYNNAASLIQPHVISLIAPYQCKELNMHLSVGTRFVINKESQATYQVYAYDPNKKKIITLSLPKKICHQTQQQNESALRRAFISVVRHHIENESGYIPYVWGGCSIIDRSKAQLIDEQLHDAKQRYYSLGDINNGSIKTGCDCAGIVLRIAQLVGIPYWYKNTTTLAHYLSPLTSHDHVSIGDLMWIPGHVMIISDIIHNRIIEARGYNHGYGKLHEIAISKVFNGINTIADLKRAYDNKQPLQRLDAAGMIKEIYKDWKILSLMNTKKEK